MPDVKEAAGADADSLQPDVPERYAHLFRVGHSINGFDPIGGNRATLLPDSNATIDAMVADIDAAQDHVHLLFYIWLPDTNGCKIVEALKRAAARNVTCRAMADGLGSRMMIRSEHWRAMQAAGVRLADGLARRQSAAAAAEGPHRSAEPSQDRRDRQPNHLLRQPELRRPGIPGQSEVCPVG